MAGSARVTRVMSQYYEFLAVDRPLTDRQMDELRSLSSSAEITPTSFIKEQEWGDLRVSPRELVATYFDAFLHVASRGTRRLMLRLPGSLLDPATARPYCAGDAARAWASDGHVILDLTFDDEGGGGWDGDWDVGRDIDRDVAPELASLVPVRTALMAGDLRPLYLAWLLCVTLEQVGDFAPEPSVPPGLDQLTAPLRALVGFLRIDPGLVDAAAFRATTATRPAAGEPRRTAGELWQTALDRRAERERLAARRLAAGR